MYITSSASSAGSGVSGRTRAMLARDENDLMLGTSNPQDPNWLTISSSAFRLQAQYEILGNVDYVMVMHISRIDGPTISNLNENWNELWDNHEHEAWEFCALDACPPPCFAKHSACCKPAPLLAYLLAEHHLFLSAVKAHRCLNEPSVAMVGPVSSGRRVYPLAPIVVPMEYSLHEHLMRRRGLAHIELMFSMIEGHKKRFIAMEERVYAFSIKMSGNDPQRRRRWYRRAIPLAINDLRKWAAEVTAEAK